MVVTIACSVLASSGFWALIQARLNRNNTDSRLLLGLAHDRIVDLGVKYLERGYITNDEYENLNNYLYEPYLAKGGNGSAKRVMEAVRKLPFRDERGKNV